MAEAIGRGWAHTAAERIDAVLTPSVAVTPEYRRENARQRTNTRGPAARKKRYSVFTENGTAAESTWK